MDTMQQLTITLDDLLAWENVPQELVARSSVDRTLSTEEIYSQ